MNGAQLRKQRVAHGIAGDLLCRRADMDRNKYFRIERGYVQPSNVEAKRLAVALAELIVAKERLAALAKECGCPELISI